MHVRVAATVLATLAVALVFTGVANAMANATTGSPTAPWIISDQTDYPPGATVQLTGGGWQPHEAVQVYTNDSAGNPWSQTDNVIADADGNLTDAVVLPNTYIPSYTVTATGSSGETATTTFTDGTTTGATVDIRKATNPGSGFATCTTTSSTSFVVGANVCAYVGITTVSGGGQGTVSVRWINPSGQETNGGTLGMAAPSSFDEIEPVNAVGTWTVEVCANATFPCATDQLLASESFNVVSSCTAPSVTTSPAAQSITYGANATFDVGASGSPGPTVQWQVSTNGGAGYTNVTGATTPGLTLTTPGVSASGNRYRAVVTNACGSVTSSDATLQVSPRNLTISGAVASDRAYDGTSAASVNFANASLSRVVGHDDVAIDSSGFIASFGDKNVGMSKPVTVTGVALTGAAAANYTVSQPSLSANITARALTISGAVAQDKVYDGTTTAAVDFGGASLVGAVFGDSVTIDSSGASASFADKNVGTGKAVTVSGVGLSGADAGNYTVSQATGLTATITAKGVTVSGITAPDKVYDGSTAAAVDFSGASPSGVVPGDSVTLATGAASGQFADKNVGTGKTVTVSGLTMTGTDAGNYALTQPTTTATITPKALTIGGAIAHSRVYDGTTAATVDFTNASLGGAVNGDSVAIGSSGYSATFADKTVGTGKAVSVAGVDLTGADAGNYTVAQPSDLTAAITAKSLTVSGITAADKVYDGTPAATLDTSSVALNGVVSGDSVTPDTTNASGQFTDKNVGQGKTVNVSGIGLSGADANNYSVAQPTTSASITPRNLSVTATGVNKVYDGTTAATVTLSTDKVSTDDVTVGYTNAAFADPNVGTAKPVSVSGLSITGGADKANYSLVNTTAATTANITGADTTTTVAQSASTQYSDVVQLAATVNGPGTPTGSVQFKINGTDVGSAQTLSGGKASLSYPLPQAPGSYTVTAVYTPDNAGWSGSTSAGQSLTVSPEDASAAYSGGTLFWGSSMSATSATATLAATITDAADGSRGDIRNARVTFVDRSTGAALSGCSNLPVGLVSSSDPTVGTATCNTSLAISNTQGATQYTIGIVVSGNYARNSSNDNAIIDVAQPLTTGFITGGGYLVNRSSSGLDAGDAGTKTNFGLNVKYNGSGTNLQGQINTIVRSGGHVYQIKGNSMTSLTTKPCSTSSPTSTCPATATFNGKASIQDITNPTSTISIDGNATLQVTMTDKGSPGTNDSIGITVWNKNGGVWFSSNWNGTQTAEQVLGGGDLSVH